MIFVPRLSSAKNNTDIHHTFYRYNVSLGVKIALQQNTLLTKGSKKHQSEEDKKKIKEVAKAKKMPKPEKIVEEEATDLKQKPKPKRQRRPEGLERPPEIPRRNN